MYYQRSQICLDYLRGSFLLKLLLWRLSCMIQNFIMPNGKLFALLQQKETEPYHQNKAQTQTQAYKETWKYNMNKR